MNRLFDEVRKLWVIETPEEKVRQRVLKKMIYALDFPKELIVVEKELKELPYLSSATIPQRRVDILCYHKQQQGGELHPLLLIECKAIAEESKALAQLIGYNSYVKAAFLALVDQTRECFGYFDKECSRYVFHEGLPSFNQCISWIKR